MARRLDKTVTGQTVRPFSGHMRRRGETSPQDVSGGRQVRGKTRSRGRSECGSHRDETPCGTSHANRSIAVRVRPPSNAGRKDTYCPSGA